MWFTFKKTEPKKTKNKKNKKTHKTKKNENTQKNKKTILNVNHIDLQKGTNNG